MTNSANTVSSPGVYLSEELITQRVTELGAKITVAYTGKPFVIVGVLTGSITFVADLIRKINLPMEIDFIAVSSYRGETTHSGEVRLIKDVGHSLEGKHILLVEDIADTGWTLQYLLKLFSTRNPLSLGVCVLLDKPSRREVEVPLDFVGFEIEDHFVVGYGLDYAGLYRNLPYIGVLEA